eukprot:15364583-Ditylum_brightwellii.AAC.1
MKRAALLWVMMPHKRMALPSKVALQLISSSLSFWLYSPVMLIQTSFLLLFQRFVTKCIVFCLYNPMRSKRKVRSNAEGEEGDFVGSYEIFVVHT